MRATNINRRKQFPNARWIALILTALGVFLAPRAEAQSRSSANVPDALHQLNDSIEALVQRVSPSVVQILVTGYGSAEDSDRKQTTDVIGRRQAVGSGVIVDPEGYIITNAHVVNGAEKIEVIVPPQIAADKQAGPGQDAQPKSYQARIIG